MLPALQFLGQIQRIMEIAAMEGKGYPLLVQFLGRQRIGIGPHEINKTAPDRLGRLITPAQKTAQRRMHGIDPLAEMMQLSGVFQSGKDGPQGFPGDGSLGGFAHGLDVVDVDIPLMQADIPQRRAKLGRKRGGQHL